MSYRILLAIPNANTSLRAYYHSKDIDSPVDMTLPVVGFHLVELKGGDKDWVALTAFSCNRCDCGPDVEPARVPSADGTYMIADTKNYVGVFETMNDGLEACKRHMLSKRGD
jgi:hypothetical protein